MDRAFGCVGLFSHHRATASLYIDWQQQEFGIAAALSQDPLMMEGLLEIVEHKKGRAPRVRIVE
jgi:hypothetical protein